MSDSRRTGNGDQPANRRLTSLGVSLPRLSLERRIGVVVVVGAVLVMGLVAALSLPIELIPSGYSSPFLRVTVPWRDAPPQELLDKITIPLEEELATVRGLENQYSFCAVGFTQVFLSFAHGTDMDVAYREVRDRIERARARMPEDVQQVFIRKDDDTMMPVAMVGLIVEEETADVYNLVQNEVILKLERVPGVASVDAQGMLEREVLIELDRQRVEAAGLNIFEIAQDLASDYFTLASGNVRAGDRKLLLRSVARYPAPQNVRDMWITDTVRLGDIASVRYDVPDDEFRVRVNGLPAYAIQVQKEGEANALDVADEVERLVKEMARNPRLAALEVGMIMSSGEIIRDSMGVLLSSGRIGALLAMIVLFFFLRRLRMSLIIAFSIPLSMVVAVVAMYFFGETFNVISLLGLMISVGLLVDNSVVVAENIHRLHQSGVGRRQSALQGAGEIALAITTATLTTVIVFLPVSLVDGQGQFMLLRLVIPITVSLLASLVVALVVVPLMVYVTLPSRQAAEKGGLRQVRDASNVVLRRAYEATFGLLNRAYRSMLGYGLRRRLDVVLALVAALALTQFAAWGRLEVVPMSEDDQAFFNIEVRLPRNLSFDETIEYFARAEEKIDGLREELGLEYLVFFHERTWGQIQGIIATDADTGLKPREVTQRVLDLMPEMPGVRFHTGFASEQETTDKAFETLTLFGEDADVLEEVANGIEDRLVRVPGVLAVKRAGEEAPNELALVLDRDLAMRQQVNPRTLAAMVGYALRGQALPRIYYGGQDIPVRIRFEEQDRQSLAELRDFSVPTETGETLAIGTLVDVRQQPAATRISRRDKQTARRITLELEEGQESEARLAVRAVAAQTELPEGVAWARRVRNVAAEETRNLMIAALMSIAFVYLLMGFLFESFLLPLAILITIPLASMGVTWIHLLSGRDLDFLGLVGLIILIGVVVNNGIVLLDSVNRLRAEGMERGQALLEATDRRFRPIMMTALTTICGMVPLLFGQPTQMGLSYKSFGLTLIGGMAAATLLTLLAVPVFYTLIEDGRAWVGRTIAGALAPRQKAPVGSAGA